MAMLMIPWRKGLALTAEAVTRMPVSLAADSPLSFAVSIALALLGVLLLRAKCKFGLG